MRSGWNSAMRWRVVAGVVLALAAPASRADILDVITSTITSASPTQLGRLSRNAIAQDWTGGEPFPGVINTTTTYNYVTFTIPVGPLRFIQISIDAPTTTEFASAYVNAYVPDSAG